MKISRIEREIRHKIFVGGYETIAPTVRLTADLEDGDDPIAALEELDAIIVPMWTNEVIDEIKLVHRRRSGNVPENDKLPDLLGSFKAMARGDA